MHVDGALWTATEEVLARVGCGCPSHTEWQGHQRLERAPGHSWDVGLVACPGPEPGSARAACEPVIG